MQALYDAAGGRAVAAGAGPGSEERPAAVPVLLGGAGQGPASPPPLAVSYATGQPGVPPCPNREPPS